MSDESSEVLYSEPRPQGSAVIVANSHGEETTVDLELLFNAVVKGKVKM